MKSRLNRRSFLKQSAAQGAGAWLLANRATAESKSVRANVALVGVGGRGRWFVQTMPKLSNVVAMCDVNSHKAKDAFDSHPNIRKFRDFRRMLDEMDRQIDAVVVAVPDHSHAVITAEAIKRGKGVLCEKPLTHAIGEARTLRELARRHKVATQMGNQGTASQGFRRAVELIGAGILGEIREAHAWNTGGGPGDRPVPTDEHPVPASLDWDLWLGPRPDRPYNSRWINWHTWREFATGQLGNWDSHTMNVIFMGLGIDRLWQATGAPVDQRAVRVEAEVSGRPDHSFPRWEIIRYDIPARGDLPPLKLNWYNGGTKAPAPREMLEERLGRRLDWGDAGEKKWRDHAGCLIIGSKGVLHSTSHNTSFSLLPEDKFKDVELPPSKLPRSRGHEHEWLEACLGGAPARSNFDYSACLTEFVLLGNIATRFPGILTFDPVNMAFANHAQANGEIHREYRKGWAL